MSIDRKRLRRAALLGSAAACLGCAALASPVAAQDLAAEDAEIEQMVVTGSRVARSGLTTPTPVTVIDSEELALQGALNLENILNELPAFGPGISSTNSNFFVSASGLSLVDLRNIGTDRTLLLVNGRRHVGGFQGTTAVDLNSIATPLIDRVDVVTGGASAVYGSEAIAGVVNIILKDDFEGVDLRVQGGITDEGDGGEFQLSGTIGGNFADGRGNAVLSMTYVNADPVRSVDRPLSSIDRFRSTTGGEIAPAFSSFIPSGRFDVEGNSQSTGAEFTFDENGNLVTVGDVANFGFNRNAFRLIRVPSERFLLSGKADYEIFDGINVFLEGTYAGTNAFTESEPIAFGSNTTVGVSADAPLLQIPTDNPFVPTPIFDAATANGEETIFFSRRGVEFGPRTASIERQTFRVATGVEWEINDRWSSEAYYQYGRVTSAQFNGGVFNVERMQQALNVEADPDNPGGFRCDDPLARAQGCVPINLFGAGSITPEALAYVETISTFDSTVEQQVASASVAGEVLDLPAGPLGVAGGVEYREEKSQFIPDPLSIAGISSGNQSAEVRGSYDVIEAFAEVVVPLISEAPFAEYLGVEAAVRVADYSTVGTTTAYKFGGEYSPVSDIRFRAVWARAIRAPNIGELFQPPSQTFVSVTDPCAASVIPTAPDPALRQANCFAIPGIDASFEPDQADLQSISGFNSGNPDLDEERADTLTIGAVITPRWISGLSLTMDYFNIEIDDAIQGFTRQTTVNQCVDQPDFPDNVFCNLITRDPVDGTIQGIDNRQENVATQIAEGIDFEFNYLFDLETAGLSDWGSVSFNWRGTYLIENSNIPFAGAIKDRDEGEVSDAEFRWNLRTTWERGPLQVSWLFRYIGETVISNEVDVFEGTIGRETYSDFTVRYLFDVGGVSMDAFAGVENAFDNVPPFIGSPFNAINVTGTETASDVFDAIGRRFFFGVNARF